VNTALERVGLGPLPHETIFGYVGHGAPTLIRRALGAQATDDLAERALRCFLDCYREHMLDNTVTYPGVREGLAMLAGRPMAVLTNKPVRFSQAIIEGLGLAKYFQYVYGGNSFEKKKPDPMGVEVLLRDFALTPRQAMMVGDSEIDVQTARNSGAWACGVTYGLGSKGLEEFPPDILLESLGELAGYLEEVEK
jgi:phosphoglycolate phosphatase